MCVWGPFPTFPFHFLVENELNSFFFSFFLIFILGFFYLKKVDLNFMFDGEPVIFRGESGISNVYLDIAFCLIKRKRKKKPERESTSFQIL